MARLAPNDPRLSYILGVLRVIEGGAFASAETSLKAYLTVPPRSDRPGPASTHEWLGRLYEESGALLRASRRSIGRRSRWSQVASSPGKPAPSRTTASEMTSDTRAARDRLHGETLKTAVGALLAYKVRALLSMIGVVIGGASIVLVVTGRADGWALRDRPNRGVGSDIAYASACRGRQSTSALSDELTLADLCRP